MEASIRSDRSLTTVLTKLKLMEFSERARLMCELQAESIHIALPIDASAFAMLASLDPIAESCPSQWVPIHVVMINAVGEPILQKFESIKVSGLVVAITIRPSSQEALGRYALTPAEMMIVKMIGMINHAGAGSFERQPIALCTQMAAMQKAIEPYAIGAGQWRKKLVATLELSAGPSWAFARGRTRCRKA